MASKFRNASNARYLRSLFYENGTEDKSVVLYTLKDEDYLGYPSLYRLYMETADPTEYEFATQYLDGWEHWKMMTQCTWFIPFVARWREELDLKIKSKSLRVVQKEADDSKSKNSFAANKMLIERAWEKSGPKVRKVGRPTTEEVTGELKRRTDEAQRINGDFERLFGDAES